MKERKNLIEELRKHHWSGGSNDYGEYDNSDEIADFILSDRRRIVEPLVFVKANYMGKKYDSRNSWVIEEAIDKTLKIAGQPV